MSANTPTLPPLPAHLLRAPRILGVINAVEPGDESVTVHDPALLEEIRAGVRQSDPPELDDDLAGSAA